MSENSDDTNENSESSTNGIIEPKLEAAPFPTSNVKNSQICRNKVQTID